MGRWRRNKMLSSEPNPPARVLRARSSFPAAHWAGVAVEGVGGHLADRAPEKRERGCAVGL